MSMILLALAYIIASSQNSMHQHQQRQKISFAFLPNFVCFDNEINWLDQR